MRVQRLSGAKTTPTSLGAPTPLTILTALFSWMRGWKVEDRGAGSFPAFSPAPVQPTVNIVAEYGVTVCPECGEKVAVLIDGLCLDCGPEAC